MMVIETLLEILPLLSAKRLHREKNHELSNVTDSNMIYLHLHNLLLYQVRVMMSK